MHWNDCIKNAQNQITIPYNWLDLHYYEALTALFRFENALRIFVFTVLKNKFHDKWMQASFEDGGRKEPQSVSSLYKKRKSQAEKFGYLGHHVDCPIMHLTSGELISIILSDSYWKELFKEYFYGSRDSIKTKMLEIVSVRNSLAHFRPVKKEDIDYVKQAINHALIQIESRLGEMIDISMAVPTNTKETWYTCVNSLGFEGCYTTLTQSKSEEWVKISIQYSPKFLSVANYSDTYMSTKVLNLRSQKTISESSELRKYVTFFLEEKKLGYIDVNGKPYVSKTISFVFRKDILSNNEESIVEGFKGLMNKIFEETELVKEDNLAKGNIVESVSCTAALNPDTGYWSFDSNQLDCLCKPGDPAEYWGNLGYTQSNFFSATSKYPWMPESVSQGFMF